MPLSKYDRIPLHARDGSVRAFALVDPEDYEGLARFRWFLGSHGYAMRTEWADGRTANHTLMHRQLFGLAHGDGCEIDHRNRDRLDNRRENLRLVTRAENMQNVPYAGVSLFRRTGRWMAYTRRRGDVPRRHLGYFATREQAEAAVRAAGEEPCR